MGKLVICYLCGKLSPGLLTAETDCSFFTSCLFYNATTHTFRVWGSRREHIYIFSRCSIIVVFVFLFPLKSHLKFLKSFHNVCEFSSGRLFLSSSGNQPKWVSPDQTFYFYHQWPHIQLRLTAEQRQPLWFHAGMNEERRKVSYNQEVKKTEPDTSSELWSQVWLPLIIFIQLLKKICHLLVREGITYFL